MCGGWVGGGGEGGACVRVLDREGSRVVARTSLAIVQTVIYLTGYSDRLTGFRDPLSPPCGCHTGVKNV